MGIFSKTESFLGVDIGAHGIKLIELRKSKNRPQLWTYGIADEKIDIHSNQKIEKNPELVQAESDKPTEEFSPESDTGATRPLFDPSTLDARAEKYAKILKDLWTKSRATTRLATASLPISYVFHAVVNLPEVDKKEIEYHVRAKVKKMLSRPIEEMQVVHQVVPADTKDKFMRVLVTAAPKELINFYSSIFQKAGLQLQELETEAFALERSLVGRDQTTAMIVDIGAERSNLFIVDRGLPVTHRSLQSGGRDMEKALAGFLGMDEKAVGQIKKDIARMSDADVDSFSSIFEPFVKPIIKEIEYSFNLFLNQTGNENKRPEKIILTGGSSVFPFFAREIGDNFNMKVFVGDPWARVVYQQGLKPILDMVGPRMSVAIGLALRNIVQ